LFPLQFKINFINPCDSATYTTPTIPDLTLSYLGPQQILTFESFTDSVSTRLGIPESCGPWTYTVTSTRSDEDNFSLTKTDVRSWTLQYVTNASYLTGTNYPLTLSGYLSGDLV